LSTSSSTPTEVTVSSAESLLEGPFPLAGFTDVFGTFLPQTFFEEGVGLKLKKLKKLVPLNQNK
jgi:hypothetical protein